MKKTLLLSIYTFIFCFCKGQYPKQICLDSNMVIVDCPTVEPKVGFQNLSDSVLERLSHTIVGESLDTNYSVIGWTIPKNDTVQVYFLYSDTETGKYLGGNNVFMDMHNYSVFWRSGYKVYDYTNEEIIYLDEQKNKLSKSIVVWQDIEK